MNRIAVFASGSGTNAASIADYFANHPDIKVSLIVTNNSNAGVIEKAVQRNIEWLLIDHSELDSNSFVQQLMDREIRFIALAGFLKLIPQQLLKAFPHRIINIHPALLPNFGGKGLYGINVHRAVAQSASPISGITIHLIDENYDRGQYVFQATTPLQKGDTAIEISKKVLQLEHRHFAPVLEVLIRLF